MAQWCSIGSQTNGQWSYSSIYGPDATGTAWCQQYLCTNTWWQTQIAGCPGTAPVQTCSPETQTQTQSCPVNYSGVITQTKTKTCTTSGQGIWGEWQTTSNTCVQNPPTCQVSSQQQTLSCQTGYTGSITQTRSSTCPDPYGQPVMGAWTTVTNTCVKSVTNPTNPTSPVSPISPVSPASSTSVQTTQSSPVTVQTPNSVPNSPTTTDGSNAPTAEGSAQPSTAPTGVKETPKTEAPATMGSPTTSNTSKGISSQSAPKGKITSVVGLVLSLELFQKPGLTQPNVFPDLNIVKGIPNDILMHDKNLMSLIQQPGFNQPEYNQDLGFEQ